MTCGVGNLAITVMRYKDGAPKLQIGPRLVAGKDGEQKFLKAGRLSKEEFEYLIIQAPLIRKALGAK